MDFYARLCELIKKNGLSQRKVEQDLGLSSASISKWKKYMPNADKVQKIAEYFNVSTEYLLTGEEKEGGEKYYLNDETAKMAQKIFESKELRTLFDAAQDASPEDLEAAHNVLLALKRKEKNYDD